jgi:hypothetical protein
VDHLRHALEALPESERPAFWRQNVRRDPTLAPLRRSTSMAKLAAAYDAGQ